MNVAPEGGATRELADRVAATPRKPPPSLRARQPRRLPEADARLSQAPRWTSSTSARELGWLTRELREDARSGKRPPRDRRVHLRPPPPRPRPQDDPRRPTEPGPDVALLQRAKQAAARPSARTPRRRARAHSARAPGSDDGSEPPPLDRRAVAKAAGFTLLGDVVADELARLRGRREAA